MTGIKGLSDSIRTWGSWFYSILRMSTWFENFIYIAAHTDLGPTKQRPQCVANSIETNSVVGRNCPTLISLIYSLWLLHTNIRFCAVLLWNGPGNWLGRKWTDFSFTVSSFINSVIYLGVRCDVCLHQKKESSRGSYWVGEWDCCCLKKSSLLLD